MQPQLCLCRRPGSGRNPPPRTRSAGACRGCAPRSPARTARPLASYLFIASNGPCHLACKVSTSPLGAYAASASCVALPSGSRVAIWLTANRSSLSARSSPCAGSRPSALRPVQEQVAAGPALAIAGLELQVAGFRIRSHRPGACRPGGPRSIASASGRQPRPERRARRRTARCRLRRRSTWPDETSAQARSAPRPSLTSSAEVGIAPQLRHVDPGEIRRAAGPPIPANDRWRVDSSGWRNRPRRRESLAPLRRRRGVQAQRVAPRAVAHHEIDLLQRERRGAAHLVGPAHGAVADDELALAEEPIGGAALGVAAAREIQAGRRSSLPSAARRMSSCGTVDVELLEAQGSTASAATTPPARAASATRSRP